MRISCKKRPIPEKNFQESLKRIEESIENITVGEIPSKMIMPVGKEKPVIGVT